MARASRPTWAKRILKLLEQARAKAPDFERFGAYSHQYKLSAPASEETVQEFEEQQGIRLPEEYRDFLDYLPTEENPTLLIYAVWCTEGVKSRRLQELYVKLLDKYRTHDNAKFDYFGLNYRGGWKLLMDEGRWKEWKWQNIR